MEVLWDVYVDLATSYDIKKITIPKIDSKGCYSAYNKKRDSR